MRIRIENERLMTRSNPRIKNIVISPLYNLITQNTVYEPKMLQSNYKYSWGKVQDYFYRKRMKITPPMHYFCEYLDDDYVFFVGAGLSQRSYFLEDLYMAQLISGIYRDAILVVVDEDWRLVIPNDRLIEGMCNFILTPLMQMFQITWENIKLIDDILFPNAYTDIKLHQNLEKRYMLEPSKYYNHEITHQIIKRYLKK